MDDKSMKPVQPESESSAENSDDDIAPEIEEILNDLPAPKQKEIRQVVSTVSMYGRFSPENSVAKKKSLKSILPECWIPKKKEWSTPTKRTSIK